MKIKLSYFLAKKRLSIESYIAKNSIATYESLVKHLDEIKVEVPKTLKEETKKAFMSKLSNANPVKVVAEKVASTASQIKNTSKSGKGSSAQRRGRRRRSASKKVES